MGLSQSQCSNQTPTLSTVTSRKRVDSGPQNGEPEQYDPRGSKYPIFKDSGPKRVLGPESLNIGYLDPLGDIPATCLGFSSRHQGPLSPGPKCMLARSAFSVFLGASTQQSCRQRLPYGQIDQRTDRWTDRWIDK